MTKHEIERESHVHYEEIRINATLLKAETIGVLLWYEKQLFIYICAWNYFKVSNRRQLLIDCHHICWKVYAFHFRKINDNLLAINKAPELI